MQFWVGPTEFVFVERLQTKATATHIFSIAFNLLLILYNHRMELGRNVLCMYFVGIYYIEVVMYKAVVCTHHVLLSFWALLLALFFHCFYIPQLLVCTSIFCLLFCFISFLCYLETHTFALWYSHKLHSWDFKILYWCCCFESLASLFCFIFDKNR